MKKLLHAVFVFWQNIRVSNHQFKLKAPEGVYIVEVSSQGLKKWYKLLKQ